MYLYYCENCGFWGKSEIQKPESECNRCGSNLVLLPCTYDEWSTMSDEGKRAVIASVETNEEYEDGIDIEADLIITQDANKNRLLSIAIETISSDEKLYVALKGTFKEYLFCTDKKVYIVKKGFMTGHTFGSGNFKMPYQNITNAEVDFHLLSGYFELSAAGLENKFLNYWSNNKRNDPKAQPNCISLTNNEKNDFIKASDFIMEMVSNSLQTVHASTTHVTHVTKSAAEEIKEFKDLFDQGIISQEEFEMKKKQLLGL